MPGTLQNASAIWSPCAARGVVRGDRVPLVLPHAGIHDLQRTRPPDKYSATHLTYVM